MATKLATSFRAGDAPDLIYMPDLMRAGFVADQTDQLSADPNYATYVQAYKDIATYQVRIYGVGFTPDMSILVRNKELFLQAGLDPEQPPGTIAEIHEMARQTHDFDPVPYGY